MISIWNYTLAFILIQCSRAKILDFLVQHGRNHSMTPNSSSKNCDVTTTWFWCIWTLTDSSAGGKLGREKTHVLMVCIFRLPTKLPVKKLKEDGTALCLSCELEFVWRTQIDRPINNTLRPQFFSDVISPSKLKPSKSNLTILHYLALI